MASISAIALSLVLSIAILLTPVRSDLVILKLDRKIDLTSHIVRVTSSLKIENTGPGVASKVLLVFPNHQARNLAELRSFCHEGKGKSKGSSERLHVEVVQPEGMPTDLAFYSVHLQKELNEGEILTLEVLAVFTHLLKPFPEQISQADVQLVLFQDSAYSLSPYVVKIQTLGIRLPSPNVESFTKFQNSKLVDSEIKYGPYENLPAFSYTPIVVHFECNRPFAVAQELLREIEISHWGNIQVTEHYKLVHGGADIKGGFSRIDYQSRPVVWGASSFRHLLARLPPRAHSFYYRDEIGNVSTSHLRGDSRKTELIIEPRYPMFGGWKTSFTVGYGLPLKDFLFESEGRRLLNISFGCPVDDLVVDDLIVKVVLPEGSKDFSSYVSFPTKQWQEIKYSHLDIVGRSVIVLQKTNVVPEHNEPFLVYYRFHNISLLREPLMLTVGFFLLFVAYVIYMRVDMSISKSSASYIAKLQWDEVQAALQQVLNIINRCLVVHDKLEASLRDLSRTGDVQSCKMARKTADNILKELMKELKPLLGFLQSSPQAAQIWPKVEELVVKEREMQERLMLKHSSVVDCYEKKHSGRELENRVALHDQKLAALKHEIDDLLETIDEIC
uniref:Dolichyl-diphosphooligosaccharide--protein glycosyltransferase subunit 1 n=1 Tax=Anthurium amnicola TaxID=1678845 RepID=A0A1D1ZGL5_9ARAE